MNDSLLALQEQAPQHQLLDKLVEDLQVQAYSIIDGFMSTDQIKHLRQTLFQIHKSGQFKMAGIGQGDQFMLRQDFRGDMIHWLDPQQPPVGSDFFFGLLDAIILVLNRRCFLGIHNYEFHFAHYEAGSFFKRHLDVFQADSARVVSMIFYLNEDWQTEDGGQLRLFLPDGRGGEESVDINPIAGRLACFISSEIPHEVIPANRTRLSLTGWLKR